MRLTRSAPDTGTTMLSVVIGVFILTLVTSVGSQMVVKTAGLVKTQGNRARFQTELVRFDDLLINLLGAIKQPLDLPTPAAEVQDQHIHFAWYGGDPAASVTVAWDWNGTTVSGPQGSVWFARIRIAGARLYDAPVWHLKLQIRRFGGAAGLPADAHATAGVPDSLTELVIPVGQLARP